MLLFSSKVDVKLSFYTVTEISFYAFLLVGLFITGKLWYRFDP